MINVTILKSKVARDGSETLFEVDFDRQESPDLGTHCWSYEDYVLVLTWADVDADDESPLVHHSQTVDRVKSMLSVSPGRWLRGLKGGLYINV